MEVVNPLAQYGQIAAIQNAQNQNAMAQLQMREAEAAMQEKNMLRRLDPTAADYESQLFKVSPQLGISYRKEAATTAAQKAAETKSLVEAAASKQKLLGQALRDISGRPSDANITAHTEDIQASPLFSAEEKAKALVTQQTLLGIPFEQRQAYLAAQGATPSELKPTLTSQDFGGGKRVISTPAFGGTATLVPGSEIAKTQTFADITAAKQAATSAGQLGLAQQKFAFEKANPTLSIQEDPSGMLAVNTITGVATPVVYGPSGFQAAPAAAPVAGPSVMRPQGAGMPSARMPAIPGMTSVLDQTVAPAALMPKPAADGMRVAGQPVGSKKEAPVKFNDTDLQLAGLAGSLKDFKEEVGKNLFTGAKFLPSGQDTARMTARYTALLMGVKDLYTLGALTGPDMSIIESQLTNPASWSGKFTTKKGFEEQIKVIEDMLKRSTTNLESTYGRVPKASRKALEGLLGGADGGIPGASANDPLGLLGVPK
jgi:hypothetical protein